MFLGDPQTYPRNTSGIWVRSPISRSNHPTQTLLGLLQQIRFAFVGVLDGHTDKLGPETDYLPIENAVLNTPKSEGHNASVGHEGSQLGVTETPGVWRER